MLDFALTASDGNVIVARLQDMKKRLGDLANLANQLGLILFEQNREAREAGLDKDGIPFADIAESTIARRRRRGDGDGPPLSPNGGASRIQGPSWSITQVNEFRWSVKLWWPDMPFLQYHVSGIPGRMPVRNPVGISVNGWSAIDQAVRDFLAIAVNP